MSSFFTNTTYMKTVDVWGGRPDCSALLHSLGLFVLRTGILPSTSRLRVEWLFRQFSSAPYQIKLNPTFRGVEFYGEGDLFLNIQQPKSIKTRIYKLRFYDFSNCIFSYSLGLCPARHS